MKIHEAQLEAGEVQAWYFTLYNYDFHNKERL